MKNISPRSPMFDDSFEKFLLQLAADPDLELEWIDLLSQLEYVGCRKIIKAVPFEAVNLSVLRHVAEEASHAYLLKAVVEQGGVKDRAWQAGRFAAVGWRYFQRLDHGVSALSDQSEYRYPGVSWAIERRVLEVYPAYLEITRNEALRKALRQILAQEKRHGAVFEAVPFPDWYRHEVITLEKVLWSDFRNEASTLLTPEPHAKVL